MQMFFEQTEQYAGNFAASRPRPSPDRSACCQAAFGSLMPGWATPRPTVRS